LEYARRRAQRGTPLTALLRAYRLGHTCFSDWLVKELARQADGAQMITAATLAMSKIVAGYVDQTSEEIVAAYTRERERWLRNRSAEEGLGQPVGENRHDVELAPRACHWLGSSVLQPARERSSAPTGAA
jgi:hypothetical protein